MAKRTKAAAITVNLLREGIIESVHHVQAVVCDSRGRVLSVAGDAEHPTFIRSALKPFQALPVTATGILERYQLSDRDLAIMCSSHAAEIIHTRQAFNILWRADIDPSALQCPIPAGKTSPLEHNCSGKHAGMLAVCKAQNWPLANYLDRHHPLQKMILSKFAEILKMPPDEFIGVHDDCGAPVYLMTISQMATLYAVLSSGASLDLERIVRAMTHHPEMIAGTGRFDTQLMQLTQGEVVSKAGAEGVQCIGKVGEGMGLTIKSNDGSKRAKFAVAIYLLQQMGWITPSVSEILTEQFLSIGTFARLEVTGELAMV
ncbi:asparaginase [Chamaesiphon sp. VAR_48_metabat_135_sub]|uniref:asparaginase n=1 Tax=Chamaesiphon sp. VAR_48_metabat_135_sub TaxID=2964699 RepID=UPI00286B9B34|nr:asparaginase [Chamaesiphon sp. VAR_48_metabat_135_sub]